MTLIWQSHSTKAHCKFKTTLVREYLARLIPKQVKNIKMQVSIRSSHNSIFSRQLQGSHCLTWWALILLKQEVQHRESRAQCNLRINKMMLCYRSDKLKYITEANISSYTLYIESKADRLIIYSLVHWHKLNHTNKWSIKRNCRHQEWVEDIDCASIF